LKLQRAVIGVMLLLAAGLAAWAGVKLLSHNLNHGHIGGVAGGLAILVAGVVALGGSAWLSWMILGGDSLSQAAQQRRPRLIVTALALFSEAGLLWLAARSVRSGQPGLAWSLGGLAVVLLVVSIVLMSFLEDRDAALMLPLAGLIVMTELSLGWLTVDLAGEGRLGYAVLTSGLALLFMAVTLLLYADDLTDLRSTPFVILVLITVISPATVAVKLALDGHSGYAWLVGGAAFVVLLACVLVLVEASPGDLIAATGQLWKAISRGLSGRTQTSDDPPGGSISILARLIGLVVPLGTLALAASRAWGNHNFDVGQVLNDIAELSMAAVALLLVQGFSLAWLRPGTPLKITELLAANTINEADEHLASLRTRESLSRTSDMSRHMKLGADFSTLMERYPDIRRRIERNPDLRKFMERVTEVRRRMERDVEFRSRTAGDPELQRRIMFALGQGERLAEGQKFFWDYEREPRLRKEIRDSEAFLANLAKDSESGYRQVSSSGPLRWLSRPLDPPGAVQENLAVTAETGIIVDAIWPRLELVLPHQVLQGLKRQYGAIAKLRVTAASALTTAVSWAFIAISVSKSMSGGSTLTVLLLGPISVALAAVLLVRPRVTAAYLRRADAVRIYRFDLAKAMHLPLPANTAGLISLARVLGQGQSSYDQLIVSTEISLADAPAALPDLSSLGQSVAALVWERAAQEIGDLLREHQVRLGRVLGEQYEQLRNILPVGNLDSQDLAQLAHDIARRASDPVSEELKRHFTGLQEAFNDQLNDSVRASIEQAVLGPPLVSFTGYLMIGLASPGLEDPALQTAGGVIAAPPGHKVSLIMSVVRDPRAQAVASVIESGPNLPFFILEPVVIEGGRTSQVAEFNAVVDSASLTPLPHRRNISVANEAQTSFAFQLPSEEGQHEAWFQLYQAGRLIQVVAVRIDTKTSPAVTA
jgi:hypothetical protein